MDRHVPPQLTYWTGVWAPAQEAISKEVAALRCALSPRSPVVSFSAGQRTSPWARDRVVRLSGRRWIALRLLAAMLEPRGHLTHIFGAVDEWHFLRCLGRRPIIFTAVSPGKLLNGSLYEKVAIFVAETLPLARMLRRAGVPDGRVRVIYPGVDLHTYTSGPLPPPKPFRLLFASSPAHPAEVDVRGIPLLIDLAHQKPDIELVLLWRRWPHERGAPRPLEGLSLPRNVRVEQCDAEGMPALYRSVHAVVCCYADGFGKSCPNSVIEGLACGRPALLANTCGISELVEERQAGVATRRTVDGLAAGAERLEAGIDAHARCARTLAEETFGLERFWKAYADVYRELC